jgi:hypothetical protein
MDNDSLYQEGLHSTDNINSSFRYWQLPTVIFRKWPFVTSENEWCHPPVGDSRRKTCILFRNNRLKHLFIYVVRSERKFEFLLSHHVPVRQKYIFQQNSCRKMSRMQQNNEAKHKRIVSTIS